MGHTEAVRDIYFTNDGYNFLSAGYDRMVTNKLSRFIMIN